MWRFTLALALFLVIVYFPLELFHAFFRSYCQASENEQEIANRDRAEALQASLEEWVNPTFLFEHVQKSFRRRANLFLKKALQKRLPSTPPKEARELPSSGPLGWAEAAALETLLLQQELVGSSSLFVWFDKDYRVIQPVGRPKTPRGTWWESLLRALIQGSEASEVDKQNSLRLISQSMGGIATLEVLAEARVRPVIIFFQGRRHMFLFLPLTDDSRSAIPNGYLIGLLPMHQFQLGWEMRYVQKRFHRRDQMIGSFRFSNETGTGEKALNPGLLNGLSQQFLRGRNTWKDQRFSYFMKPWSQDQDLLLISGVRRRGGGWLITLEAWMATGKKVVELAFALTVLLFAQGFLRIRLNLGDKFRIGTAVLVFIPLAFMCVIGLQHFPRLKQQQFEEKNRLADTAFMQIRQEIAVGKKWLTRQILQQLNGELSKASPEPARLEKIFSPFRRVGLEKIFYISPAAKIFKSGWSDRKEDFVLQSMLNKLLWVVIDANKFKVPPDLFPESEIAEAKMVFQQATSRRDELVSRTGSIEQMELAGKLLMSFFDFGRNSKKERVSFLFLVFDHDRLRDALLQRFVLGKTSRKPWKTYLKPLGKPAFSALPAGIEEMVEQVELNRLQIRKDLPEFAPPRRFVVARLLMDLGMVAVVSQPVARHEEWLSRSRHILLVMALLVSISGFVLVDLLRRVLYQPVIELTATVSQVEKGDLRRRAVVRARDEIGDLSSDFNAMVKGLQEKARMAPFLNRELVARASRLQSQSVERRLAAVSFAGLRRFSELEATLPLEEAMGLMSHFLGLCENFAGNHSGGIDKFIGDVAMAVFFDDGGRHPLLRAVEAGKDLQQACHAWMEERGRNDLPLIRFGVGIAYGTVVAGSIGSLKKRLDFTVIGDTVNLAARLEKLAGGGGHPEILLSGDVSPEIATQEGWESVGIGAVRGRKGSLRVFTLNGEKRS